MDRCRYGVHTVRSNREKERIVHSEGLSQGTLVEGLFNGQAFRGSSPDENLPGVGSTGNLRCFR